jgi:hypothetical protein
MFPEIQIKPPKAAVEDERSTTKSGFKPNPQATGTTLLTAGMTY